MEKSIGQSVLNWVADRRIITEVMLTIATLCFFFLYNSMITDTRPFMVSMLTLSFFYFIGSFFLFESTDIVTIMSSKVVGIASAVCTLGILFTVLHFEGAKNQLMIGMISLLPAALVAGVSYLRNQSEGLLVLFIRGIAVFSASLYYFQSTIQ